MLICKWTSGLNVSMDQNHLTSDPTKQKGQGKVLTQTQANDQLLVIAHPCILNLFHHNGQILSQDKEGQQNIFTKSDEKR